MTRSQAPRSPHRPQPHRRSASRPSRLRSQALLAVLVLLAAGHAAAEVRSAGLDFEPPDPTWRDRTRVTIRGESDCIVTLGDVQAKLDGVDVALAQSCSFAPPVFTPFALSVELPRLVPGGHMVRLTEGGLVLAQRTLTVFGYLTDVILTVPDEPIVAGEPFTFVVTGDEGCDFSDAAVVEGSLITGDVEVVCLGPRVDAPYHATFTVPGLPAGDYTLRAAEILNPPFFLVHRPLHVYDPDGCVPSPTALCLGDDRFRVEVTWADFQGGSGDGHPVPLEGRDDTGLFWFFNPDNVELTVKVLRGCGVNGHYWVFVSSGSTVEYEVTVTDTRTDQTRTYGNDSGAQPPLVADTNAFATCP